MTNPGGLRSSFARIFLRYLSRINSGRVPSPRGKHRSIRIAAYASMASAVGTRRAWSREVLRRTRRGGVRRICWRTSELPVGRKGRKGPGSGKKLKKEAGMRRKAGDGNEAGSSIRGMRKKLRRLVPGGEGMEFHRLLAETAHYVECLRTQVEVMRSIADHYTPV